jgi:hypothetical protein
MTPFVVVKRSLMEKQMAKIQLGSKSGVELELYPLYKKIK